MSGPDGTPHVFPQGRKPGELLFSTLILLFAAAMLAQIGWQTTWLPGKGWAAQPRLWPAIGLGGMLVFAGLNWMAVRSQDRRPGRWQEAALWLRSLEYAGWYLVYVAGVPLVGYLPATLAFCLFLTWRLGYRAPQAYAAALAFALSVVLLFKTVFNVKIPGGALYDLAPDGLRYILFRYF
ncbi:MAG: tripartite tricarboxylate transporter TctB family protein [Paracoccaceae bacterium]|nr:MAG: tripartite tricarboxylate transporter TctB family protein [Paracoccaceae bacterium]